MTFHPDHPYKLFAGIGDAAQGYWYRRDEDGVLFGNERVSTARVLWGTCTVRVL